MTTRPIARHRTAIQRRDLSRPIRQALEAGLISHETVVFDYGCGYGDDIEHLRSRGIQCSGWDPVHNRRGRRHPADVVNLGYVINVIETIEERAAVLREVWALARKVLIVAARLTMEGKGEQQREYEDGCLTRWGTFQKYYQQHELRTWIDETLGVSSIPAGPGIFYIFRDADFQQSFIASRYRRQSSIPRQHQSDVLFEEYKVLFEPLMAFMTTRGRLPEISELAEAPRICEVVGSLQRAFSLIRRVTGTEQWDRIRDERGQDLLIYLALARFSGRPHLGQLPHDLQLDVRAFFSTYNHACTLADELLYSAGNLHTVNDACRSASVGKLTPNALYVHTTALPYLPPVLRIYEGCARAYIGAVEGANIIKLHRNSPEISYLAYPAFERDPHPALAASLIVPLQTFRIQYRDYTEAKNPPILHRKEAFVPPDHPLRSKFARLTQQEERWGLYAEPQSIGTRENWERLLQGRGLRFTGHRLLRQRC